MKSFEVKITVRYAETDAMGIVHHATYPIWFEVARTEILKYIEMPYDKIESEGILLPLIELNCKYTKPAKYGDDVKVKIKVDSFSYVKFVFSYEVIREKDNALLVIGSTTHVATDKDLRPVNIKKKMPELYDKLKNYE